MQTARIISASLEDATLLADQLRSRGFSVEIARPSESRVSEVDFEIELQVCGIEEAVDRASKIAHSKGADVFVGPGVIENLPEHLKLTKAPLAQPTLTDTINGIAAGLQNKRDLMAKALWEQRALLRQERAAQRERVQLAEQRSEIEKPENERVRRDPEPQRMAEWQKRILQQEREESVVLQIVAREQAEGAQRGSGLRGERMPQVVSARARQWRASFAIAGICAVILTVGWAAALRRPTSPSALIKASKAADQAVSFGSSTFAPEQQPVVRKVPPQALATSRKDSELPQSSRVEERGTKQRSVSRRRPTKQHDDVIAEDEVVYLNPKQAHSSPQHPSAAQRASLRRYSDMQ